MPLSPAKHLTGRKKRSALSGGLSVIVCSAAAVLSLSGILPPSTDAAAVHMKSAEWRILFSTLDSQNRFIHDSGISLIAIKPGNNSLIIYQNPTGTIKNIEFRRVISLIRVGFIHAHNVRRRVYLKDGSYLSGRSIASNGNNFYIATRFGTIKVPLTDATGLGTAGQDINRREAAAHDRLFLNGGGLLKGTFLACNIDGIKMHSALGIQVIPWSRVKELVLGGLPPRITKHRTATIQLINGSVIHASTLQLTHRRFTILSQSGLTLHIPESMVGKINTRGGDVTWLAQIPPQVYRQTPLFGKPWPVELNRNSTGGKLRVDDITYHHGIGLQAPCTITYRLDHRYDYLVFAAQMDDSAEKIGRGEVKVMVNGRIIYSSGTLVAGKPPVFVKVPIQDAESITISTRSAEFLATRCRIDLLDAAIIR
ncbi:MAG: NPCBM/NEW2 domain-containing protein [Phycisphaerae bacterium]